MTHELAGVTPFKKAYETLLHLKKCDESSKIIDSLLDPVLTPPISDEMVTYCLAAKDDFVTGVLGSRLLTPHQVECISPKAAAASFELQTRHSSWELCPEAEANLIVSMQNELCIIVNGSFVFKLLKKPTALCIADIKNNSGQVCLRGHWYTPMDETIRAIQKAESLGEAQLTLASTAWCYMRPVYSNLRHTSPIVAQMYADTLMEDVDQYVQTLPTRLPDRINGIRRSPYLEGYMEIFGKPRWSSGK